MTLEQNQVARAANALLKHVKSKGSQSGGQQNELFGDEKVVWLQVGLKTVPDPKKKPFRIEVPNAVLASDAEICLITKDPQKDFKQLIADKGIKNIAKVIGVSKLREKYKAYEQKRQLCDLYDVFLADERVLPMLPKLLGKTFFEKKKQPLSVNLQKKDLAAEIESALNATYLYLGLGVCCSVKIGHTGHSSAQLVENILAGMEGIVQHVPGKWKNIQSVHIKTSDSTSLPIYNSLPFSDTAPAEANENAEKKTESSQSKTPKKAAASKESEPAQSKASKKTPAASEKATPAKAAEPVANGKAPKAKAAATPASEKTPKAKTPAAKATPAASTKKTPVAKATPASQANTPVAKATRSAAKVAPSTGSKKTPARTPGTAAKRGAATPGEAPKSAKKQRT